MKLGVFNALSRWIDSTKNDLPFNKRVGAYIIDWILGGIFSGLPAILCYGFLTKRSDMFSNLYVFPSLGYKVYWSFLAGILCVMFALFYYVYVPLNTIDTYNMYREKGVKAANDDALRGAYMQFVFRRFEDGHRVKPENMNLTEIDKLIKGTKLTPVAAVKIPTE